MKEAEKLDWNQIVPEAKEGDQETIMEPPAKFKRPGATSKFMN